MAAKKATRGPKVPHRKVEGSAIVVRVVFASLALAIVAFAVQGGEYGTTDLLRQRRTIAAERARVDSLEASIARLQLERKAIEGDAATQERVAREEFGMVKGERELLYRFVDTLPDSARR